MFEDRFRTFSREFKLKAIGRMDAGENVSALSRELEVKREILYRRPQSRSAQARLTRASRLLAAS